MGGESTASASPCKRSRANSPQPPVEVEQPSAHFRYFVTFAGVLHRRGAEGSRLSRILRESALELARDSCPRGGIAEAFRAHGDERRANFEQVARVASRAYSAHPDDRNCDATRDARDLRERDRANGRAGEAAAPSAEPGAGAVGGQGDGAQ